MKKPTHQDYIKILFDAESAVKDIYSFARSKEKQAEFLLFGEEAVEKGNKLFWDLGGAQGTLRDMALEGYEASSYSNAVRSLVQKTLSYRTQFGGILKEAGRAVDEGVFEHEFQNTQRLEDFLQSE